MGPNTEGFFDVKAFLVSYVLEAVFLSLGFTAMYVVWKTRVMGRLEEESRDV